MHKAKYEFLSGSKQFYGEIPGLDGVYANQALGASLRFTTLLF